MNKRYQRSGQLQGDKKNRIEHDTIISWQHDETL